MKPIRPGERGPAVEDIQRRLHQLGYDLGPTGIDGVFFGRTADAVRAFKATAGMPSDAIVDEDTWSALVDATFTLGDRMLYLRLPHFHGRDVRVLQEALNALGFACGQADGILGTYCERALREFQRNAGLVPDGIVGDETVRAILALRHVWEGKDARAHSAAHVAPARAESVLSHLAFAVSGLDDAGRAIARRVVNLALASTPEARAVFVDPDGEEPPGTRFHLRVSMDGTASATTGCPVVRLDPVDTLPARLITAFETAKTFCPQVVIEVTSMQPDDEHELQRAAVRLLDAVCVVFD